MNENERISEHKLQTSSSTSLECNAAACLSAPECGPTYIYDRLPVRRMLPSPIASKTSYTRQSTIPALPKNMYTYTNCCVVSESNNTEGGAHIFIVFTLALTSMLLIYYICQPQSHATSKPVTATWNVQSAIAGMINFDLH